MLINIVGQKLGLYLKMALLVFFHFLHCVHIIVVKINKTRASWIDACHLRTCIIESAEIGCHGHFAYLFLDAFRKTKVNKHRFVVLRTPHNIFRFDVPMDNFETVHQLQTESHLLNIVIRKVDVLLAKLYSKLNSRVIN